MSETRFRRVSPVSGNRLGVKSHVQRVLMMDEERCWMAVVLVIFVLGPILVSIDDERRELLDL